MNPSTHCPHAYEHVPCQTHILLACPEWIRITCTKRKEIQMPQGVNRKTVEGQGRVPNSIQGIALRIQFPFV